MRVSRQAMPIVVALAAFTTLTAAKAGAIPFSYSGSPTATLTGTALLPAATNRYAVQNGSTPTISADAAGGIVSGSLAGIYAAPTMNQTGTAYTGNYFSTGMSADTPIASTGGAAYRVDLTNADAIVLHFSHDQTYLGLLWGSVDGQTGHENVLSFYNSGTYVGSITGAEVAAATGVSIYGLQSYGGSTYLNINFNPGFSFNEVAAGSQMSSFEFADVHYAANADPVPEPGSLILLGTALIGLGLASRRRRR